VNYALLTIYLFLATQPQILKKKNAENFLLGSVFQRNMETDAGCLTATQYEDVKLIAFIHFFFFCIVE
jgi:hypothetical protein